MSATNNTWSEIRSEIEENQDGASGYPSPVIVDHMEESLEAFPLRFGGENYGFLLWMKPQDGKIREGMSSLVSCMEEYDKEVILKLEALHEVKSLVAKLAEKPNGSPPPRKGPKTKGQLAYEAKAPWDTWPSIGKELGLKHPCNSAKKWAKSQGLEWPLR